MTVSKPQNRKEFKEHILIKLGKPVLEINVSDEQLDIAIDDSFQYFNERNHFNGVERMYLSIDMGNSNVRKNFSSFGEEDVRNTKMDTEYVNTVRAQKNFVMMPYDVVGVTKILRARRFGFGQGIFPPGFGFPGLIGSITGDACDQTGYGLIQYYALQEYMALIEFLLYPPRS